MRQGTELYSVDANVIVRFLRKDHPKLSPKAWEIMRGVETGRTTVTCDPVNLGEVVWVLKSVYKLSNDEIVELLQPILGADGFLVPNKERYLLALQLLSHGVKHFGDACACAAALEDCEGRLYSFDAGLSNVPGMTRSESVPHTK